MNEPWDYTRQECVVDVKTVSSILGHASADADAKRAAAIDEVMERRLSPQETGSFA